MADLANTYRTHAAKAQAEADSATLDNVRDRNQRAANAWTEMADRQDRTDLAREKREAATAAASAAARVLAVELLD